MTHGRIAALIRTLGLRPHPEGGHYAEIFRSPDRVLTPRGERAASLRYPERRSRQATGRA